jgi:hypothetical protein
MDDAKAGQQPKSSRNAKLRRTIGFYPNHQTHDEEGQTIYEVDDDDIISEKLCQWIHN